VRSAGIDPGRARTTPAHVLDRLEQALGILRSNESVVDQVLGTIGLVRAPGEAISKCGAVEVEDEFDEQSVESFRQRLKVLDERGSGQVLPEDDVVAGALRCSPARARMSRLA